MTKKEAMREFREFVLPVIREKYEQYGRIDIPARREAWCNFTDALCKSGRITQRQDYTWGNPY